MRSTRSIQKSIQFDVSSTTIDINKTVRLAVVNSISLRERVTKGYAAKSSTTHKKTKVAV